MTDTPEPSPTTITPSPNAPIGVMGAMAEEVAALLDALEPDADPIIHGGRSFHTGTLFGQRVVLTASRCGKVAAAATATELIVRFRVSSLVFTGVAGGLADGVRVGDIVIADSFIQHDLDGSPIYARHEIPLLGVTELTADPDLAALAHTAAIDTTHDHPSLRASTVHRGLIISGDRFVSTTTERDTLRADLPAALCVEMEGAAVAQVAHEYQVPVAVVRLISDAADDDAAETFRLALGERAGLVATGVLSKLFAQLPADALAPNL